MAIKPIDTEDDELYEDGLPPGSMLKFVALLAIIAIGMVFGFFYNQNQHEIKQQMVKAGIRPTTYPTALPFKPVAAYNPDVDSTLDQIGEESSKLVGDGVANVLEMGSDVLGSTTQNVTKSVQTTAANSTQEMTNSLYKSTIGQVILQLFNQLPPAAKKDMVKELIKQITPSPKPTPEE